MAKKRRIQTPIKQHWNHFRTGLLPLLAFIACIWGTMYLWQRRANQGTIVAAAEASSVDVASGSNGLLRSLVALGQREKEWQSWDEIGKGEIIAVLDDQLLRQEIEVVRGDTVRLIADLESTKSRTEADLRALKQRYDQNKFDRVFEASRFRIQLKQVDVDIINDKMEARTLRQQLEFLVKAGDAAAQRDKVALQTQIDQLHSRYRANIELSYQIKAQLARTEAFAKEYAEELSLPQLDKMQENLEKAIAAQDAQIDLIGMQIENMTIRSPVAGVITTIHKRPGEAIVEGDPVMTIASDSAEYVVGYWRNDHFERPSETMVVTVRLPQPDGVEYESQIEEIGPQYGEVPVPQRRDASRREYGVPVRVPIPDELQGTLRPGELVHLIYRGEKRK